MTSTQRARLLAQCAQHVRLSRVTKKIRIKPIIERERWRVPRPRAVARRWSPGSGAATARRRASARATPRAAPRARRDRCRRATRDARRHAHHRRRRVSARARALAVRRRVTVESNARASARSVVEASSSPQFDDMSRARLRWSYKDEVGGWKGYNERLGLRYDRETIDTVRWTTRARATRARTLDGGRRRRRRRLTGRAW